MAGVSSRISLQDNVSRPALGMAEAMSRLIDRFEKLSDIMERSYELHSLSMAQQHTNQLSKTAEEVGRRTTENADKQKKYNKELEHGSRSANSLLQKIQGIVASYIGLRAAGKILQFSDDQVLIKARLELASDGTQSIEELEQMVISSANRARAEYGSTAASIAKLGITAKNAFSGTKEIVAFAELLNKSFKISGASAQEQAAGVYQLTQAMASGRLQGDEFRSIIENAPLLAKAIADYSNVSQGELKEMASKGEISAQLIKNALFDAADDIEERFNKMPMTFRDVFARMQNASRVVFTPLLSELAKLANDKRFQDSMQDMVGTLAMMARIAGITIRVIATGINWLHSSWSVLKYPIGAVVAAMLTYKAVMLASTAASALLTASHTAQAIGIAFLTKGTIAAAAAARGLTAAQWALNAAFLANPIFWIPAIIVIVIGLFTGLIAVINRVAGTSYSAFGIITGALWGLAATGQSVIAFFFNLFAAFAEYLANFAKNPLFAAQMLLINFANSVIGIVQNIAKAIDAVFGSNLSGAVGAFSNRINTWGSEHKPTGYKEMTMKAWDAGEMAKKGYDWGKGLVSKIKMPDTAGFDYSKFGTVADHVVGINDKAGKIGDKMDDSAEDLKYLRDLAEREIIDRTVLRDVKVEVQNTFGDIRETADVDGIINTITDRLEEALAAGGEG